MKPIPKPVLKSTKPSPKSAPKSATKSAPVAELVAFAVLVLLALLSGLACGRAAVPTPRNVVLISIDTLRPDKLGCYGYARQTSPAIDALAAGGALFETVTSTAPWTIPAHGSLLTGLYPNRHGLLSHSQALPASVVTWAEYLRERGFETAAVVNSHNLSRRYGIHRGFGSFRYVEESLDLAGPSQVEAVAARWLSKHPPEPFFLFLHYYDVHSDYTSLPEYQEPFLQPYSGRIDGSTRQLRRFRAGQLTLDDRDVARLVDLYDAGVRQMDAGIERLVRLLEREGHLDDTLIVVTSDHGEEFLEHGGVLHGRTQYDEVMRVPLVLNGPGVREGLRLQEPVSLVDVMPTVIALLGLPVPEALDGQDLTPLLNGRSGRATPDRLVFGQASHDYEEYDLTHSVRSDGFKLIHDARSGEWRLYDLSEDPQELVDVQQAHPILTRRLRSALEAFMETRVLGAELPALDPDEVERLRALGYL